MSDRLTKAMCRLALSPRKKSSLSRSKRRCWRTFDRANRRPREAPSRFPWKFPWMSLAGAALACLMVFAIAEREPLPGACATAGDRCKKPHPSLLEEPEQPFVPIPYVDAAGTLRAR
jgi:hypothetical protein